MQYFYFSCVCFLIIERIIELFISRKNQKTLLLKGYEFTEPRWQFILMVLVHVAWFVFLFLEPVIFPRAYSFDLFVIGSTVFLFAQALRFWVIATLGEEWNISVMCPIDRSIYKEGVIERGPYKYIRHPNYLAIILEFASIPLIGGAYFTAVIFSVLNMLVLKLRISSEEKALYSRAGYAETFGRKQSLLPKLIQHYQVISLSPK